MKTLFLSMAALGAGVSMAVAQTSSSTVTNSGSSTTIGGGTKAENCKVVELKPGENPPSANLSTSITAGNGKVTGTTTGPGGTVTHSSSGSGSVSMSSSSDGQSTTVTDSNGNCTIYRKATKAK